MAPSSDQIEVLVFGPGYGESILIHIGYGEWIIADSCINPETRKPAPLEYLKQIGLSPDCVKLVIATHWHDDHIRGLYEIIRQCDKADFFLSEAFVQDEFIKLISAYGFETTIKSTSGIQELYNVISFLRSVNRKPKRAIEGRILWERKNPARGYSCEIRSLSPSDTSILVSNLNVAELIPRLKTAKKRVPSLTPNYGSVVLWISINNNIILLGSDLENTKEEDTGWIGILSSNTCPSEKAKVFKIPHHGSANADNSQIWKGIVDKEPFAVLTPYKNGRVALPKDCDIQRICERTTKSYITASFKEKKLRTEYKTDKLMEGYIRNRRLVHSDFGYVQLRRDISKSSSEWEVYLFGRASELCE